MGLCHTKRHLVTWPNIMSYSITYGAFCLSNNRRVISDSGSHFVSNFCKLIIFFYMQNRYKIKTKSIFFILYYKTYLLFFYPPFSQIVFRSPFSHSILNSFRNSFLHFVTHFFVSSLISSLTVYIFAYLRRRTIINNYTLKCITPINVIQRTL